MGTGQSIRKEHGAAYVLLVVRVDNEKVNVRLHVHDFNSEVQMRAYNRERELRELYELKPHLSTLPDPEDPCKDLDAYVGVANSDGDGDYARVKVDIHAKRTIEELIAERARL